ncbi:MAG: NAD(P)H-hydrate dehydratase [Butyrivibrio sp.]|nr:NAD(P)H-hydrate dehydratase [Butyrivibrio sp.]
MKYALDAAMSKKVDSYTINEMGVPSLVLMERAALAVASKVAEIAADFCRQVRICAVCGSGNNGADGVAAARILTWQGLPVDIIIAGDEKKGSPEFAAQVGIASNSGMTFCNISSIEEYDIVIDAVFGTGLSRGIEGAYADIINTINMCRSVTVSVDIPSGISADTGNVLGTAVRADATVTFGYNKQGLLLYPGREFAGEITVADIGFCPEAIRSLNPAMYFTAEDIDGIPVRSALANKGTYGRTLIIAGSESMSGAAYLAAAAAYKSGVGLAEVFTHSANCSVIRTLLPEAIVTGYEADNATELLEPLLKKANTVILGPGLSTDGTAVSIVKKVLTEANQPLIIDADALNIISSDTNILKSCRSTVIITPHIGEMMRLTGKDKNEILADTVGVAASFAKEYNVVCVLKNAATVVAEPDGKHRVYINNSGCAAMAKGGSGDVLTGVIAGMLALRIEPFSAASMGVYVHGLAGETAADDCGSHAVVASDILERLGKVTEHN